ncbi:MAG: CpaF family protein, partial [Devosia sp.]
MFGKRTTFGGNTPSVQELPRPQPSVITQQRAELATRQLDNAVGKPRQDDVVDVRSPAAAARDKEYVQT